MGRSALTESSSVKSSSAMIDMSETGSSDAGQDME
ncbi:hypothetical protein FOQG_08391 [Fusarium oxysporum f. sp. raphani 54005]|uniref:Uncharacterized protein n=2 Tax=Fusarium oxysporum TaxID=5507 RepID=X0D1P4_FUSOX|nr:hypothetical protein FOQG_08391 [Fusarium oxysporum f. sp. raphani 54005]EXL83071.1 hypothetical protein FOPG_04093 [Fusarium oxysporum f. sp. conglutinans race 2 54008]